MGTGNEHTKRGFFEGSPFYIKEIFFFVVVFYLFFYIQFAVQWLIGYDGFFHIKYSAILADEGFISDLPWLQYTIHRDAYRDHHLLFHYLVIPFTFGDLMLGGKIAAVTFASVMGLALYSLLNSAGVRYPSLWSLAAILSSHTFLFRMSLLRVQSLSLALLLLIFLFMMKRKYMLVYFVSILFVWLYDGFPLLIVFSFVFFISGWLVDKKLDMKMLYVPLLGIATGLLVNPYFPENIMSFIYNIERTLFESPSGIKLGHEWYPYKTWYLVKNSMPVFVIFPLTLLFLPLVKKITREEYAAFCLNLVFFILTLKSRRFIEYWPVFAFLSASLIIGRRVRGRYVVVGFLLFLPLMNINIRAAVEENKSYHDPVRYEGASKWFDKNTSQGDIVFNADWDDFPFLFFYNHKNYYIVGLDPMYLYTYDSDKSELYRQVTRGKKDDPAGIIMEEFNSRYVFLDKGHKALYKKLKKDPMAQKVFSDKGGYIFRLLPEEERPE